MRVFGVPDPNALTLAQYRGLLSRIKDVLAAENGDDTRASMERSRDLREERSAACRKLLNLT